MGDTMIESLYIENFAIIDQVQIDFQSGMTVLTGETGAGKSIIIDAIGQLIGQRSQPSFVKNGADCAFIEGVFSSNKEIDKILLDNNFPIDEHLVPYDMKKRALTLLSTLSKLIIVILVNYY
jgi:DNA repair protein RecN (Recombination protein N)